MAVCARPASADGARGRTVPQARRPLSADGQETTATEPRTLAARKAYPAEDAPLDLSVRKEITVRDFARHPFADPEDYMRAQAILRESRGFLAAARDSGTESDDSAGRLSPADDAAPGKAYKKSLMKRYSEFTIKFYFFSNFELNFQN